ncbi:SRPBCC family protein, partial [Mycobacteroides abscessus]|uniref:SRPBCC family protein n=1 Tax=Mycobacteroides abscessus TaxID=36809 RepID=UPI00104254A8
GFPATFTSFDLRPGGLAHYRMTSPQNEHFLSLWQISEVDAPRRIVFRDLFATEDGDVDESMPGSETVLSFESIDTGSRVTVVTAFASSADLDQLVEMGM